MKTKLIVPLSAALIASIVSFRVSATAVSYSATDVLGATWQFDFTISNDTLGSAIGNFNIFFDPALSGITPVSQPVDFAGPFAADPIPAGGGFPAFAGFVNYLASDSGIDASDTVGGFVIDATFAGAGAPPEPTWQVLDANFNVIDAGSATPAGSVSADEPSAGGLSVLALLLLSATVCLRRWFPSTESRAPRNGPVIAD